MHFSLHFPLSTPPPHHNSVISMLLKVSACVSGKSLVVSTFSNFGCTEFLDYFGHFVEEELCGEETRCGPV